MSGDVSALMELMPRMRMEGLLASGSLLSTICTPATLPFRASMALADCDLAMSSALMTPAEPVKLSRFCLPKATTMTSSRFCWSDDSTILMLGLMATLFVCIPI